MQNSGWNIIAASVVGTSHIEKNVLCQDAFACETFTTADDKVLLIVASDGAGSAKHGKTGAETTCRTITNLFRSALANQTGSLSLHKDFAQTCLANLQNEFIVQAARENGTPADYACTLLVAAIETERALFWQIGDGAIVYSEAGEFKTFVAPQQGEYANSTYFVTDAHAADFLQVGTIEKRIDEVAVFTDGLQRIALDLKTAAPHAPFFRPMFAPLKKNDFSPSLNDRLVEFLKSPKINERTDDDKTLILAARRNVLSKPSMVADGQ